MNWQPETSIIHTKKSSTLPTEFMKKPPSPASPIHHDDKDDNEDEDEDDGQDDGQDVDHGDDQGDDQDDGNDGECRHPTMLVLC